MEVKKNRKKIIIWLTLLGLFIIGAVSFSIFNFYTTPAVVETSPTAATTLNPITDTVQLSTPCWSTKLPATYTESLNSGTYINCGTVTDIWGITEYNKKTVNTLTPSSEGVLLVVPVSGKSLESIGISTASGFASYETVTDVPPTASTPTPMPSSTVNPTTTPTSSPTASTSPTVAPTPTPYYTTDTVYEITLDKEKAIEIPLQVKGWKTATKILVLTPAKTSYANSVGEKIGGFVIYYLSNSDKAAETYNTIVNTWKWVK